MKHRVLLSIVQCICPVCSTLPSWTINYLMLLTHRSQFAWFHVIFFTSVFFALNTTLFCSMQETFWNILISLTEYFICFYCICSIMDLNMVSFWCWFLALLVFGKLFSWISYMINCSDLLLLSMLFRMVKDKFITNFSESLLVQGLWHACLRDSWKCSNFEKNSRFLEVLENR